MLETRKRWQTSAAMSFMLRPAPEYARSAAAAGDGSWPQALRVPVLLAVMLGLLNATAAAGHVSATLVASEIVAWSFVPVLQLLTGAGLIASAGARRVTFVRAMELLFAAHLPWSLWLAATVVFQTIRPDPYIAIGSGVVPMAVTAVMLMAFGREVLGLSRREARVRVCAHQAATILLIVGYIELATRLSVRIIGAFGA
jgi:hypothetical protein